MHSVFVNLILAEFGFFTLMSSSSVSSVLVTGSAGFLGQALVSTLAGAGLNVRGLDVVAGPVIDGVLPVEALVGDVSDPEAVARACASQEALVIAHMAPNRPGVYDTAELPFDINVKGTALLFENAVRLGMKRVVLISSIAVVDGYRADNIRLTCALPARPLSPYGLTKVCQEEIAAYHHRVSGLSVAILRPAYVTDADTLTDKYGRHRASVNWQYVDRRDVAGAVLAALRAPALTFGRYFVHGHPGAMAKLETEPAARELGWSPRYDFRAYPDDLPV